MTDNNDTPGFGQLHQALITSILKKDGFSSQAERQAAFENTHLFAPLSTLIDKVANYAYRITDEDVSAVKAAGMEENRIFELIVCAAVGQASRQYNNALAALAQVKNDEEEGTHAS
jgi:hypothetical protein